MSSFRTRSHQPQVVVSTDLGAMHVPRVKFNASGHGTHRLFRLCRVTLVPFFPRCIRNKLATHKRPTLTLRVFVCDGLGWVPPLARSRTMPSCSIFEGRTC